MRRTSWVTPELFVLGSGAEAQANKVQTFAESPGEACDTGVGCPGSADLAGPS
jgi:hypothetical protein